MAEFMRIGSKLLDEILDEAGVCVPMAGLRLKQDEKCDRCPIQSLCARVIMEELR